MKKVRGTARRNRRSNMREFHAMQCEERDKSNWRLMGDAPRMEMPRYYIKHLNDLNKRA